MTGTGGTVTGPDGTVYDPADCRIGVRAGHSIVRVTLWHPHWGSAKTAALRAGLFGTAGTAGVPGTTGAAGGPDRPGNPDRPGASGISVAPDPAVARQLLDAALGAETVATWIGEVEVTDRSPEHAVSMADLRDLVARMASAATDPDGRPRHTELRMEVDDASAVIRTIVPLAPSVAPGRDRHVGVTLHIDPFRATDLTGAQVRSTVLALEDALSATVRENHAGLLVAVVHRGGEGTGEAGSGLGGVGLDDVVTLHFYLGAPGAPGMAGEAGAADAAELDHVINTLRATVSTWELGEASLTDDVDPTWSTVQQFRV